MCDDRSNDSSTKTCDVPIIPWPNIDKIRALIRQDFEELRLSRQTRDIGTARTPPLES